MRSFLCFLFLVSAASAQEEAVFQGAKQPQVTVARDGTVSVVMIRNRNIEVCVSTDKGKSFGRTVTAIDAKGNARGGLRRGPRIGSDKKGNLVVTAPICYDPQELDREYPKSELWLVRSDDRGKTWSDRARVNSAPKKAAEALHWMAVAPNGDAHVAWLDHRKGRQNAVWYAKVAGKKVGKNIQLTGAVCECCAPGLAVDALGNPVMVVRERKSLNRGLLLTRSRNKGRSFPPARPINTIPSGIAG